MNSTKGEGYVQRMKFSTVFIEIFFCLLPMYNNNPIKTVLESLELGDLNVLFSSPLRLESMFGIISPDRYGT